MEISEKLKIKIPLDSAISLLGMFPKEVKTQYYSALCTPMSMAAQFTIAKSSVKSICPSIDKRIKKISCLHIIEHYSSMKKNKFERTIGKGIHLENNIKQNKSDTQI